MKKKILAKDDAVVVAPIIMINNEPYLTLALHYRPPLAHKRSGGLHIEVCGGLTKDDEAKRTVAKTGTNEVLEEFGLKYVDKILGSKFKGTTASGGMTDESSSLFARIFKMPKNNYFDLNKIKKDTILKTFRVPLKNALNFLKEKSDQKFSVGLNTMGAVTNAMRALKVQPNYETTNIQATELWSMQGQEKTIFQRLGFEKREGQAFHEDIYATAA